MIQPAVFIPDVIPDETVYSICCRYHQLSGSPSWSATNAYLFGAPCHKSIVPTPSRLGHFSARFGGLYEDPLDVINRHTAFPYFRTFVIDKEKERAEHEAILGTGQNHRSWVSSNIENPKVLHYCEACLKEQLVQHHRNAWLRSHQLSGVYVCHRHGLPLIESSVPTHAMYVKDGARYEFPSAVARQSAHQMGSRDDAWQRSAMLISTLSHQLLKRDDCFVDPQFRSEAYRRKLATMGYGTRGQLDYDRIVQDMCQFYGERYLHYTRILSGDGNRTRSFIKVFHNTRPAHPLNHLALIGFAFGSLDFYRESLENVISSGWRKGEFKRPIRTTARGISKCAFQNASIHLEQDIVLPTERLRKIFDQEKSSSIRRTKKQLNTEICTAYASGKSREEIARMFKVHTATVHRYIADNSGAIALRHEEACFFRTRDARRRELNEAISTMHGASRSEIRRQHPQSYNWLYKRDKEWLFENLPPDRKKATRASKAQ